MSFSGIENRKGLNKQLNSSPNRLSEHKQHPLRLLSKLKKYLFQYTYVFNTARL
jgi:hypothetical protein